MTWLRITARWSPRRIGAALLWFVVLAIVLLPLTLGQGGADAGAEARRQHGRWVVTAAAQDGVAARVGLRVGDVIVALDGTSPHTRRRTDPGLDLSAAHIWGVLRHGRRLTLRPAWAGAGGTIALESALLVVIALVFGGTGAFVRLVKPDDAIVRRFYQLCLAAALALALSQAAGADVPWAKALEVAAFALLPALCLDFCLWFAWRTPLVGWRVRPVWALYGMGVVVGCLTLVMGFVGAEWYDSVHTLMLALLALGFLGGLTALVSGYVHPHSTETRRQTGIVLLGTATATLPLTGLCLAPEIMGAPPLVHPEGAALGAVFLPLSIGYAILRYRLWEIAIVGRALVHAAMTLLLAGCYLIFLYEVDRIGLNHQAQGNPLFVLAFFAAVTVTFIPVRDRVRRMVDRMAYGDRYDHARTLRVLGAQLASVRPIEDTLSDVAEELVGALDLRGAAILLRTPEGGLAVRAAGGDCRDTALATALVDQAAGRERTNGAGHWVPLDAHGEESGLLYLGPKRSPFGLGDADLRLAETIASQAAVAIANTLLVERLRAKVDELELLRDRLLRVQAEERKRLSHDLHDGAYHAALDVVRQAQLLAGTAPLSDAATPCLHALVERGKDVAYELQTLSVNLYPPELGHLGLVAALGYLARTTSRDEDLVTHLTTAMFPTEQRLPREIEDVLYRVARQAIDNALRHAAARAATIDLALDGRQVTLAVRDDGRGFAPPSSAAALLRGGHLGLVSMRESIDGLGGLFSVISTPGAGTEVRACVPLPPDVQMVMTRETEVELCSRYASC